MTETKIEKKNYPQIFRPQMWTNKIATEHLVPNSNMSEIDHNPGQLWKCQNQFWTNSGMLWHPLKDNHVVFICIIKCGSTWKPLTHIFVWRKFPCDQEIMDLSTHRHTYIPVYYNMGVTAPWHSSQEWTSPNYRPCKQLNFNIQMVNLLSCNWLNMPHT